MIPAEHYIDLRDGRFHPPNSQDLAALFARVEASPFRDHLVVHFHGGLVSRASAEKSADILKPYYDASHAYPIFFFWRSDLLSILTANLSQIADEPMFRRLLKRLVQLAIGKLAIDTDARSNGLLELPPEDSVPDDPTAIAAYADAREKTFSHHSVRPLTFLQEETAEEELIEDPILQIESAAIAVAAGADLSNAGQTRGAAAPSVAARSSRVASLIQEELAAEADSVGSRSRGPITFYTVARHGLAVLRRVISRFSEGRDHGLYTTITEEILREFYVGDLGSGVWNLMKQDTLDAFNADPAIYGGTAFLQHLQTWWKPGRRITLVGHSTGAIYIGRLLEKADALLPPEITFDCVFLAPACTFEFIRDRLPIFQRRVRRKLMFALNDEIERSYWEVPVLYRGSLLYMVSGLFEAPDHDRPIVGMQRYFSRTHPYVDDALAGVVDYFGNDVVWSRTVAGAPRPSSAGTHSELDSDAATLQSVREFLAAAV